LTPFYAPLIQNLWLAYCKKEWQRFDRAADNVAAVQRNILFNYLKSNARTIFGRRFHFNNITSISQFQHTLPLTTYDDYHDEISAITEGKQCILTRDKVRLFEPSSGTAGPNKLIPYTSALKKEFHRGISSWLYNLYSHHPDLKGTAYWSVSPASTYVPQCSSIVPIGFETDSDYLGPFGRIVTNSLQAVPAEVRFIRDIDSFRYVTLLFLLIHRDLHLISVWNPTFLTLLLDSLAEYWDNLLNDLSSGNISPPGPIDKAVYEKLRRKLRPAPLRAKEICDCGPGNFEKIWPRLSLISCWLDGPSGAQAAYLQKRYFHKIQIQGKGLIATEAFVSFPLVEMEGAVLAGTSHFFEFIPLKDSVNPKSDPVLAHQLETGRAYSVVVTTGGGLYRYQLQDTIQVIGHYKKMPRIRFTGKLDGISDIYGEKLNEQFVNEELTQQFSLRAHQPRFFLLCPDQDLTRYILYLEDSSVGEAVCSSLAEEIDKRFRKNFHYDYCRKLGQLKAIQINFTGPEAIRKYFAYCRSKGMRQGDIKASVLCKTPIDQSVFQ
jgi:hypothetical protein